MSLRHALLGLLVDRPSSGYDLMKLFHTSLANVWPATQSQVYGELTRLSGSGHIEVTAEGPRGRKEYALTEEGRAELHRWLAEPPPDQPQRSEAMLRVFFLGLLTPAEAVAHLTRRAELADERHGELLKVREAVDWDDGMLSVNGRLALEYGLRLRTMEAEWARWAVRRITAERDGSGGSVGAGPGSGGDAGEGAGGRA